MTLRPGVLFGLVLLAAFLLMLACDLGVAKSIKTVRRAEDRATRPSVQLVAKTPLPSGDGVSRPSVEPAAEASGPSDEVLALMRSLVALRVAVRGSEVKYDRGDWRHWVDADRDCQNTRAEVLIAESAGPVSFTPNADGEECRVTGGKWRGPWSGEFFTDAGDVDIDHHVPLAHAHESGGWNWDQKRKRAYANDLDHPATLQATSKSVNRNKGKQPPDQWRPDETAGWCRYAADWIAVKSKWQLTITEREAKALREMLITCDYAGSWGLFRSRQP